MQPLPPIPTPAAQSWKEFRIRVLPVVVFLAALIGVWRLWQTDLLAPSLVGEVEAVQTTVSSRQTGVLAQFNLGLYQEVKAGETLGQVIITEPKVLASSLAVIQAEIGLLRANLQPLMSQQRYNLTYDRYHMDWLQERARLATAKVNLQLADAEFRRMDALFKDKIVSDRMFEQAKAAKDKAETEVQQLTQLVAEEEKQLQTLSLPNLPIAETGAQTNFVSADALQAAIRVQEEKLRLTEAQLNPLPLVAPVDGVIGAIFRRTGETVLAGDPIVTISRAHSDRIVGYLRPPVPKEVKVGSPVRVTTRAFTRELGMGQVLRVGAQMEAITNGVFRRPGINVTEIGLPILVSLPANLKVMPGEVVDLTLAPPAK